MCRLVEYKLSPPMYNHLFCLSNSKHGETLQNLLQMLHLWIQTILTGAGTG